MGNCKGDFPTYIGTTKDISKDKLEKLKELKLPIFFYDDNDGSYYDEVGGFHSAAEGWNPQGVWCGECTNESCVNCPSKDIKEDK